MTDAEQRPNSETDLRYRQLLELAVELDRPDLWRLLFCEIDERGLLGDLLGHVAGTPESRLFGVFDRAAADLERFLLPAAVALADWPRWLHFLLLGANLRGLAEALAEREILSALVRSGRLDFARQVALRLPGAQARARALCAILAALPAAASREDAARLKGDLRAALDEGAAAGSGPEADAWSAMLAEAARTVPRTYLQTWPDWLARLGSRPELADRVRLALVEGFVLDGETGPGSTAWEHLAALHRPQEGRAVFEALAARAADGDLWPLLDRLAQRLGAEAGWSFLLAAARRRAAADEDPVPLWRRGNERWGTPPWSAALVDAGGGLWGRLPAELIAPHLETIADPAAEAALRIATWNLDAEPTSAAAIRHAVERIPDGDERLRRHLDFLWAFRRGPRRELRASLAGVSRHLGRVRYAVPEPTLASWLDLVAEIEPKDLRREVDDLFWSPAGAPGLLRTLVERSLSPGLQKDLLERAEVHAATVATTEAEGFELRREAIIRLTCRHYRERETLDGLDRIANRLLPEEEDRLRAALAEELAEAGRPHLAERAAQGIGEPRLRLLAQLRAHRRRPVPEHLVAPLELYRATANVAPIEDELAALAALHQPADEPEAAADTYLDGFHRRGRQIEALVDFGWHALETQRRRFRASAQDRTAVVLPLRRALGVVESPEWLLGLAPELVELGSHLGRAELLAEVQEAVERVIQLDAAPWPARLRAIETVLAAVPRLLATDWPGVSAGDPVRVRTAARLLRWLLALPDDLPAGPGRDALRGDWHRVVPRISALIERLPELVRRHLDHPVRAWLCYRGPGALASPAGRDRLWAWLGRLAGDDRPAPEGRIGELAGAGSGRWSWLAEDRREAVRLCLASRDQRLRAVEALLAARGAVAAEAAEPLVYPLAPVDPGVCVELLERLDPGPARDDLCLRLVRHGWLSPPAAGRAVELIGEDSVRGLAAVWLEAGQGEPAERGGLAALTDAIASGLLSPDEPGNARLRRRVWRHASRPPLEPLARAAIESLRGSGGESALAAARWWLAAALAPDLGGEASSERRALVVELRTAAARASSLSGGGDGEAPPARDRTDRPRSEPDDSTPDDSTGPSADDSSAEAAVRVASPNPPGGATTGAPVPAPFRFDRIQRLWRKSLRRRPRALTWLESPRAALGTVSVMVAITTAATLLMVDSFLYTTERTFPAGPSPPDAAGVLVAGVLVCIVQALLVDRLLEERFPGRGAVPGWWRPARAAVAAVPLFGLYAIPAWQWLIARRGRPAAAPHWTPRSASEDRAWRRPRAGASPLVAAARRIHSGAGMAVLFVAGFVVLFGFCRVALAGEGREAVGAAPLAVLTLIRLAGAGAAAIVLWQTARKWRLPAPGRWALAAVSAIWLVPPGGAFFGLMILALADAMLPPDPSERSLGGATIGGMTAVAALPAWQRRAAGSELVPRGRWWRRRARGRRTAERARGEGGIERRFFLFCRGKAALSFFDAAAVGWVVRSAGEAELVPARGPRTALEALFALTLVAGAVGLGLMVVAAVARRRASAGGPGVAPLLAAAPYFAAAPLGAFAGLAFGDAVAVGDVTAAGNVLALVGSVGAGFGVAGPLRSDDRARQRIGLLATSGYCWVGLVGLGMGRGSAGPGFVPALEQLFWFGPVSGLLLGAIGLRTLRLALRAEGDGGLDADGLRSRIERPGLVVPAVLPLGGFAAPLWALAWHRRRRAVRLGLLGSAARGEA